MLNSVLTDGHNSDLFELLENKGWASATKHSFYLEPWSEKAEANSKINGYKNNKIRLQ